MFELTKFNLGAYQKIHSVRFWLLRSHVIVAFITSLLLFILLQVLLLVYPKGITLKVDITLYITLVSFSIGLFTSIYIGYKNSNYVKKRLDDISTFITILSRGKFSERIKIDNQDELGQLADGINQIAEKFQNQVKSLQKLAEEKNDLAQKAHSAATIEERQRLARELHDSVSQQLFALSIMSSAAIRMFDTKPEIAKKQLGEIGNIASQAQAEMRALLLHLRPVSLKNDSLCDGIKKLMEELQAKTPITFESSMEELPSITAVYEDHLFRIIQEALSNILRHADATVVKLQMHQKDNYVYIFISDNGKGFELNMNKLSSYGLDTMRERCEELGGQFSIRSKPGEGTHIEIHIPIREEEPQ